MSGREQILGKIRKAVGPGADDAGRRAAVAERLARPVTHPIPDRVAGKDKAALDALLKSNLAASLVTVVDAPTAADVPAAVAGYLRQQNLPQQVVTGEDAFLDGLPWDREPALSHRKGKAEASDDVGLSRALAAVAETGTLALESGPDNPVTVTFLPETHIVVVEASRVVGPYEEVWKAIRARHGEGKMPRTVNFVTGPSRTADIGGKIVIGAHGPRRLCVVFVGS